MSSSKTPPVERLLSITALGIASAALLFALSPAEATDAGPPVPTSSEEGADSAELAQLRRRVAQLEQRLQTAPATSVRTEVFDQTRVAEWIEQALDAREARAAGATSDGPPRTAAEARQQAEARLLAEQLEQAPFGPARDALWEELRKSGGVDTAVAYFEQLAEANPGSPDCQTDLGSAYIQKMLATTDEHERIELGQRIEAQFDRALELQPDHWEARFRKAVGLTYGPALSGRRDEAIGHFETLLQQQATGASQSGFSQSYLYLGRLYAERGDRDRALRVWEQGLGRHPGDSALRDALGR